MSDKLTALALKVQRMECRIAALEQIAFRLPPSATADGFETVEAVRTYIRNVKIEPCDLPQGAVAFLNEHLPVDWRELVRMHGHAMVYPMLAQNYNIVEARRKLA